MIDEQLIQEIEQDYPGCIAEIVWYGLRMSRPVYDEEGLITSWETVAEIEVDKPTDRPELTWY